MLALTSQIIDGNCEEILLLLSTNPFTIAKFCVPLFGIVFFPENDKES